MKETKYHLAITQRYDTELASRTHKLYSLILNGGEVFLPVTDPALVAHWPLAVAAVDV